MAALFQFENHINQLKAEIEAFPNDASLWMVPKGVTNSPGNLALHLAGNLQHFVGALLGNTGYVRDRDLEFSLKGQSKDFVLEQIEKAHQVVKTTLSSMTEAQENEIFPSDFKGKMVKVSVALSHLLAHLAYHNGQINYLRRMLYA
ncbi:MAG: DinB family protein [Bacteroidia bacterium]